MEVNIKLSSIGITGHYLKRLEKPDGSESKTYLVKTDTPTSRIEYLNDGRRCLCLFGGPVIVEGEVLEEANAVVKSIDFVVGYGHTITFE